jgi:hypothetical protein
MYYNKGRLPSGIGVSRSGDAASVSGERHLASSAGTLVVRGRRDGKESFYLGFDRWVTTAGLFETVVSTSADSSQRSKPLHAQPAQGICENEPHAPEESPRLGAAMKPPARQSQAPVVSTAFWGGPSRPAIGRYPTGWEYSPRVPQSKRRSTELPPSRPQSRQVPGNPRGKYPAFRATPLC